MSTSKHKSSRNKLGRRSPQDVVRDLIGRMELAPAERTLVECICAQWVRLEDILEIAAGPREPVGELLIKAGRITRGQLDQALEEQRLTGDRLGQILVSKSWLSEPELSALLAFQAGLGTTGGQHAGPLQLGNLLVSTGKITHEQLEDAVHRQSASKQRIGEALVEAGYITEQQITQGLTLQRVLVSTALAALLVLSLTSGDARASTKSAQIRVSASVAPFVRIDVLQQQPSLTITAEDIQRGYVDVAAGTSLRTRTNDRNGYLVNFDSRSNVFERATITGLGAAAEIGTQGGVIRAAYAGPETSAQVSYRFYLAQGAQSGSYPWPLHMSASVAY